MLRITNINESLDFYCNKFGLVEVKRTESEKGRFTLIFLTAPSDLQESQIKHGPLLELTYNWDPQP